MITDEKMVEVYATAIRAQRETPSGRVEIHISEDVRDAIREQWSTLKRDDPGWLHQNLTMWGFPMLLVPGEQRLEVHAITRIDVTL